MARRTIPKRTNCALLALLTAAMGAAAPSAAEFHHVCTYGSKDGIHPPKVSNKKAAVAATGLSEHPYGLGFPTAVITDQQRRLWITDSGTNSVHIFDRSTGAYRELRKAGDFTLAQPAGIATDAQGRIYLVDTALANIFVWEEGEYARSLMKPAEHLLTAPTLIALSENGRTLYVADPPRNVIVALNREGEVDETIKLTEASRDPAAIAVINNQLYVLGSRQHKIEIFSPAGERVGDLQFDGNRVPTAFAFDPATRRFYVGNPRLMDVEIFTEDGHSIGAFGQLGDRVDQHRRIEYLHIDPQGAVYLVNSHSGKVLVFESTEARPPVVATPPE